MSEDKHIAGRLNGKVAVITGAASGIGLASTELFINEGARVVAADIQTDKGEELISRFGDAVRFVRCDVCEELDIRLAIQTAVQEYGGLDIMFNNAGITGPAAAVIDLDVGDWDKTMAVMLRSVMLGIRHSAPHLRARGGGSIINTSSIAGIRGGVGPAAYSVAKAGVMHLSKIAASELGAHYIRVNSILPGFTATPMFGGMINADRATADRMARALEPGLAKMQPLPRSGRAIDIARAALFLASDESSWITGLELIADGGFMVRLTPEYNVGVPNSIIDLVDSAAAAAHEGVGG